MAPTTVRKERNTLSVALQKAADIGWCSHALAREVVPPFAAESKPKLRWLTREELPQLMRALDTTPQLAKRLEASQLELRADEIAAELRERMALVANRHLFVLVACLTGAELSALERLQWTDIDFAKQTIRIPGTKTTDRDRRIPLDPQLAGSRCCRGSPS